MSKAFQHDRVDIAAEALAQLVAAEVFDAIPSGVYRRVACRAAM